MVESVRDRSDNRIESYLYNIYVNVMCKSNVTRTVRDVKNTLLENGFQLVEVTSTEIFDGEDFYQTVIHVRKHMAA